MEGVEGMLDRLRLSAKEKKTLKIGKDQVPGKVVVDRRPQAVAKLLSEKNVQAEVIENSVGWIWCPAKGISCKDLGKNVFLITFNQESRVRRAVDDGPWSISKEVLVIEEFDGSKAVEDFAFSSIPIWLRVDRLPLGLMCRETVEMLGDEIGEFVEVAADGNDSAVGRVLRIKVRLNILKPLRRGVMVDLGDEKGERWCPICYEHLPDFCYTCGLIGHVEKTCSKKLENGEASPYGKELRYIPPRKNTFARSQESGVFFSGRSGGSGSWRSGRSDSGSGGGRGRSDAPSWRKETGKEVPKIIDGKVREEEEVQSPLKNPVAKETVGGGGRRLCFEKKDGQDSSLNDKNGGIAVVGQQAGTNSTMQERTVELGGKKKGTFKRNPHEEKTVSGALSSRGGEQKRRKESEDEMEVDVQGSNKKAVDIS